MSNEEWGALNLYYENVFLSSCPRTGMSPTYHRKAKKAARVHGMRRAYAVGAINTFYHRNRIRVAYTQDRLQPTLSL